MRLQRSVTSIDIDAVSQNGDWAIVTSETTHMPHWIDTSTQELVDNTLVDQRPRDAEFTEHDKEFWVSSEIGGTIPVIDVDTRQITHTINFEIPGFASDRIQPVGMELNGGWQLRVVALGPANHEASVNQQPYQPESYV